MFVCGPSVTADLNVPYIDHTAGSMTAQTESLLPGTLITGAPLNKAQYRYESLHCGIDAARQPKRAIQWRLTLWIPRSDQYQTSPAASPEMLHRTV